MPASDPGPGPRDFFFLSNTQYLRIKNIDSITHRAFYSYINLSGNGFVVAGSKVFSVTNGSSVNYQPASGHAIQMRSIYGGATNFTAVGYDGTNTTAAFDQASLRWSGAHRHLFTNTYYLRLSNSSGGTQVLAIGAIDILTSAAGVATLIQSFTNGTTTSWQPASGHVYLISGQEGNIFLLLLVGDGTNDSDAGVVEWPSAPGRHDPKNFITNNTVYARIKSTSTGVAGYGAWDI